MVDNKSNPQMLERLRCAAGEEMSAANLSADESYSISDSGDLFVLSYINKASNSGVCYAGTIKLAELDLDDAESFVRAAKAIASNVGKWQEEDKKLDAEFNSYQKFMSLLMAGLRLKRVESCEFFQVRNSDNSINFMHGFVILGTSRTLNHLKMSIDDICKLNDGDIKCTVDKALSVIDSGREEMRKMTEFRGYNVI